MQYQQYKKINLIYIFKNRNEKNNNKFIKIYINKITYAQSHLVK